jgi:hypothetical protein
MRMVHPSIPVRRTQPPRSPGRHLCSIQHHQTRQALPSRHLHPADRLQGRIHVHVTEAHLCSTERSRRLRQNQMPDTVYIQHGSRTRQSHAAGIQSADRPVRHSTGLATRRQTSLHAIRTRPSHAPATSRPWPSTPTEMPEPGRTRMVVLQLHGDVHTCDATLTRP